MKQENCKDCIHYHQAKELINDDSFFGGEWVIKPICTLFLDWKEESGKEPLLMILDSDDDGVICECYKERDEK